MACSALICGIALFCAAGQATGAAPLPLRLIADNAHHLRFSEPEAGVYEIVTLGGDPFISTEPFASPPDFTVHSVLSFECFTTTPTDLTQVYYLPSASEARSITGPGIPHSEAWTEYALDLGQKPGAWPARCEGLRIDFGTHADRTLRIRNLVLRAPTLREREIAAAREAKRREAAALETRIATYLATEFPCTVEAVQVGADSVTVAGTLDRASTDHYLCEIAMHEHATVLDQFVFAQPLPDAGAFQVKLPRIAGDGDARRDRLFSKWVVARLGDGRPELRSHARHADAVVPLHDLPAEVPRGKKGLGGFGAYRGHVEDLDELGISSVTVNVLLTFLRSAAGPQTEPHRFNGRDFHVAMDQIAHLDRTLVAASERSLTVLAILLVPRASHFPDAAIGRTLQHPDCEPTAQYSMPNLTTAEGFWHYAATIDFLAQRYSRPDRRFGRIHHWIVHNEVDMGRIWTNAGEKPPHVYMDLYQKSMRTAYYVARQYTAHAKAFISLTHHWNATSGDPGFESKNLLDILLRYSRAEGDFEWAVAQHPYPESLFNPRTWEDRRIDFTLDTPLLTFRNIEVLAAWARQPHTWFRGHMPRTIHLTEQGLNSPDYSDESFRDQAAGMAYAWKKVSVLDEIEAFQYHNWMDHPHEGGLRLGLRKLPGDPDDPAGKKPVWHLYQKLETPGEDEACAPYLEHVGLPDWDAARHPVGDILP